MTERIIMLGTGSAMPQHSYNTCYIVDTGEGKLLVDAGGGNQILTILKENGINPGELRHMFVSHTHTDHILGAVWLLRRIVQLSIEDLYHDKFKVYGNTDVISALCDICRLTFLDSYFSKMSETVDFEIVKAGDSKKISGARIKFIDCRSENVNQTGLDILLPSGKRLCCLGDEALTQENLNAVEGADYLVCGAFCRYADREIFKPYEKHHLTVKDVAATAESARIGTLILVHCEDRTAENREKLYKAEASEVYKGLVIVPEDNEILELDKFPI